MGGASSGVCELCGQEAPKAQMARHLAACAPQHDAAPKREKVVQLLIEAAGVPEYWLYVEGRESASLEHLDDLLRAIWLECCGHMSAFYFRGGELAKRSRLGSFLIRKGNRFQYEYDFGSTTRLTGRSVTFREGTTGRRAVRLLARNSPLEWRCESCSSPATVVCSLCFYSGSSLFCEAHASQHGCAHEDPFLPVVNSPRMGICGYTG